MGVEAFVLAPSAP